jgi:non-ribosomal peptide synthetase component F
MIDGPTETTIWSSSFTLPRQPGQLINKSGAVVIPIGMPISQVKQNYLK